VWGTMPDCVYSRAVCFRVVGGGAMKKDVYCAENRDRSASVGKVKAQRETQKRPKEF